MTALAIRGHATRGKEVIEILEMLGGRNLLLQQGCGKGIYLIDTSGHTIIYINEKDIIDKFIVFTLEEFLEKFPYKVGDKVKTKVLDFIGTIINMRWVNNENTIVYEVEWNDDTKSKLTYYSNGLQPYTEQKEETMEETKKDLDWHPTDYLEFVDNDEFADEVELNLGDSYEILLKDGKYYAVKKKPQYPKTYRECYELVNCLDDNEVIGHKKDLLYAFQRLLVCRDAYWKIAGDWKPDWENDDDCYFAIATTKGGIGLMSSIYIENGILVFPTEEMRNAFYENFKDLIEECKELL